MQELSNSAEQLTRLGDKAGQSILWKLRETLPESNVRVNLGAVNIETGQLGGRDQRLPVCYESLAGRQRHFASERHVHIHSAGKWHKYVRPDATVGASASALSAHSGPTMLNVVARR